MAQPLIDRMGIMSARRAAKVHRLALDAVTLLASTVVSEPIWTTRQKRLRRTILRQAPAILYGEPR